MNLYLQTKPKNWFERASIGYVTSDLAFNILAQTRFGPKLDQKSETIDLTEPAKTFKSHGPWIHRPESIGPKSSRNLGPGQESWPRTKKIKFSDRIRNE